jgi:hypothetical protein
MAIEKIVTTDGIKLRDSKSGELKGSVGKGASAPSSATAPVIPNPRQSAENETGLDSLIQRFEATKSEDALTRLTADHEAAEAKLAEFLEYSADLPDRAEIFRVSELGVDPWAFDPDALVTKDNAIYLLRLNKANAREALDEEQARLEAAAGASYISEFGDRRLGNAVEDGVYEPNSKEWLLLRTRGLGGSDKIGEMVEDYDPITGEKTIRFVAFDESGRHQQLNSVFAKKSPSAIANIEAMEEGGSREASTAFIAAEIGNRLERAVQRRFAREDQTGLQHFEDKASRHDPQRPWHRFNVDGLLYDPATGTYGITEIKTSKSGGTYDRARKGYLAQCLHNVAGAYGNSEGPKVTFAVLVAEVEGETEQRRERYDFTEDMIVGYREALDRAWLLHKPAYDAREAGQA